MAAMGNVFRIQLCSPAVKPRLGRYPKISGYQAPQMKSSSTIMRTNLKRIALFIVGRERPYGKRPVGGKPSSSRAVVKAATGHYGLLVRTAFKEWAIVVDALGRGEQIVILRKGGIREGRGGFHVEHPQFWLFP